MKKVILIMVAVLIATSGSIAQNEVTKNKPEKELNFYDYQKDFYSFWAPYNLDRNGYYLKDGIKKKAVGWKQFKRWEWSMKGQIDFKTGRLPQKSAQQIYNEYLISQTKSFKAQTANWSNLGPNSSAGGYAGIGRIGAVAFHPTDNNTYWVGAPSGGLWRTTDNGSSWTCLTDNNDVLGVSDIIIPSDYDVSHTIYIATGDRDASHNYSIGVLKSTDNGDTWNTTGITFGIGDDKLIYKMILNPNDNQTILAATTDGILKTSDGGTTWSNTLNYTEFVDLEAKPTDFNTLYASSSDGSIHVTTDGGNNWTITNNNGSRVELAVTPANNNYVYAIVCNNDDGLESILKSTDSGTNFSIVYDGSILNHNLLGWEADGSDQGGQGAYDLCIAISPTDANRVIIGGVNTWNSTDGGNTFSIVTSWTGTDYGAQHIHADQHMLNYRSNGDLFLCNDGGIYLSTNNGTTFTDKTNGIVISQMYKIGVSKLSSGEVITGLQDNGSKLLSAGIWTDVSGGDAMECIIDYTNNNTQYVASESGTIFKTIDHWGDLDVITPFDAGTGAWVTPYLIHPTDPNILYAGYSDVWKTTDKGENWVSISTINTDDLFESMAISSDGGTLYVADDNTIWKSTNDGNSWVEINNNLPYNSILSIAVKDGNPDVVWVTLGGYDNNGVYESINGGTSWSNISTGLPNLPVYTIVQNKQNLQNNHLYVGTQIGVFFKNGPDNWIVYNNGLPNVRIGELEIYYDNVLSQSKLRAGTFGRGLWESDLYLNTYTISANVSPSNSGATTGEGTYDNGATVNLSATVVTDYSFVNWTENGTQVSTDPNYSFTVSTDRILVANFENVAGISIVDNDKSFNFYPNPTKELINIKFNNLSINNQSNVKLYLIDNLGKKIELKVISFSSNEIQTNIGNNEKGIYYLQLIIDKKLIKTFKVIVTG